MIEGDAPRRLIEGRTGLQWSARHQVRTADLAHVGTAASAYSIHGIARAECEIGLRCHRERRLAVHGVAIADFAAKQIDCEAWRNKIRAGQHRRYIGAVEMQVKGAD